MGLKMNWFETKLAIWSLTNKLFRLKIKKSEHSKNNHQANIFKDLSKLPNLLSLFRILISPAISYSLVNDQNKISLLLISAGALSDLVFSILILV